MPQLSLHSPVGALTVSEEEGRIVSLDWGWGRDQTPTTALLAAVAALERYFDGAAETFDLPMEPAGTAYQRRVWAVLRTIPFGATLTYAAVAARAGGGPRSAGNAVGANPIPILIPCHRVLGARSLGGYSGGEGLDTKRYLLALEEGLRAG
ncbi:MAG: methylated-DNA--[protein]-cysteine S-methyltransferase [Acetobacteraceae bacterium]